jgi:hypothetical protein
MLWEAHVHNTESRTNDHICQGLEASLEEVGISCTGDGSWSWQGHKRRDDHKEFDGPGSGAYCILVVTCAGNCFDYFSIPYWNKNDRELNVIWAKGLGGYVPFNPHLACKGFKPLQPSSILVGEVITEYCFSRLWCAPLKNCSIPFHLFLSWSHQFQFLVWMQNWLR